MGRSALVAVRLVLLVAFACAGPARGQIAKDYRIKAAFLYNFTKFVDWPAGSFADGSSPIVIGVIGEEAFRREVESVVRDKKAHGRRIDVRPLGSADELKRVHVAFVAEGEEARFEAIMAAKTAGLLTVGESSRFATMPGMVTFITIDGKVRFEINVVAAEAAGLKVSAQLQKLAIAVRKKM